MAKIKIPLQIRYRDLDTLGHVNSSVYLTYFEIARVEMFMDYFVSHPEFGFVVAKCSIDYLKPLFLNDKAFITSWVGKIGNSSFSLIYEVIKNDDEIVARGETVQVHVKNGSKAQLPEDFVEILEKYLN